jgi:hypothetical protein
MGCKNHCCNFYHWIYFLSRIPSSKFWGNPSNLNYLLRPIDKRYTFSLMDFYIKDQYKESWWSKIHLACHKWNANRSAHSLDLIIYHLLFHKVVLCTKFIWINFIIKFTDHAKHVEIVQKVIHESFFEAWNT